MFNPIMNVLNNAIIKVQASAALSGVSNYSFQPNSALASLDGIGAAVIQVISFGGILAGTTAFGFAAIIYGTAQGDPKKGEAAKTQATYGAIAFACVAVAQTVRQLVFTTLDVQPTVSRGLNILANLLA